LARSASPRISAIKCLQLRHELALLGFSRKTVNLVANIFTRRQIMRVRVDGTSSEGSTSNTLDLTPPEVDVTKATIRASPAKMLT
jgi:hypothetical protein